LAGIFEGVAISAAGKVIGETIVRAYKKARKPVYDEFDLDRFFEKGINYVGIRNTGNKSIDACVIHSEGQICRWWDNHKAIPRIIASGGGGNVQVPLRTDSNPLIEVSSRHKTLRKIRFLDITQRVSKS
jgi:hypothetical protein